MIIEKVKEADLPQLIILYKQLVPFENKLCDIKKVFERIDNDEKYFLLCAKEENKLIGTALGVICDDLALGGQPFMVVESVVVDLNWRGKGVGTKIFQKLDEFAIKHNCVDCIIVSSGHRTKAHKFYESLGFTDEVRGFRKNY